MRAPPGEKDRAPYWAGNRAEASCNCTELPSIAHAAGADERGHGKFFIIEPMGDSGEGLVDAEARIAERLEERAAEKRRAAAAPREVNVERAREIESLRLARTEFQRQLAATCHAARRGQLEQAIAEITRRLEALTG
jgi:hypothetical protein